MSLPRLLVDGLDHVLAGLGAPSASAITAVLAAWDTLLGPELAGHTSAASIEHGRLVVHVDEPAWADRLAWSERQVIARLDALVGVGVVDRLDVRVRSLTAPP